MLLCLVCDCSEQELSLLKRCAGSAQGYFGGLLGAAVTALPCVTSLDFFAPALAIEGSQEVAQFGQARSLKALLRFASSPTFGH